VVRLTWDANTEADLAGYRVRYGTTSGAAAQGAVDVGNRTACSVLDLDANTTYYFVVHAYDLAGNESPASNEVAARPAVVAGPRLEITVTDAPDPVGAGNTVTYTLAYANGGDVEATGVTLRDAIPAHTSFVSATGGGVLSEGVVSWNLGILTPGAAGSVTLTVRVTSPLANGTVISNSAYSIAGNETAPVSGPPVTTTVTSAPVLAIALTDSPDPVVPGDPLTYTIAYSNSGNANTSGVVITDPVPANTSFVSATGGGAHNAGVVTWSIGALNAGSSGSRQVVVRVNSPLAAGTTLSNGGYQIDSNETAPVGGPPVLTSVVSAPPPVIDTVVEAGTGKSYVLQSAAMAIEVRGSNFRSGAVVGPGSGITAGQASLAGSGLLTVPVTVAATAALGPRTVTVTNPDGGFASKAGALSVVKTADINRDCLIDAVDLNLLARAWSWCGGDADYNPAADLDGDGCVDGVDLTIWGYFFGQKLEVCP
jgi:uncharacterized repeat protein (TIGR01451 family)